MTTKKVVLENCKLWLGFGVGLHFVVLNMPSAFDQGQSKCNSDTVSEGKTTSDQQWSEEVLSTHVKQGPAL